MKMPVENEYKAVLCLYEGLEDKTQKLARDILYIEQAYLLRSSDLTVRIRKQRDRKDKVKHYLTCKSKIDGKVIEIEKKISEEDFVDLSKKAEGWVNKIRYLVGPWEVDFFKRGNDTYFIMAEIELPEGVPAPGRLPKLITDHLLYIVPHDDSRFSSKKLSDLEYAKKLLAEVSK